MDYCNASNQIGSFVPSGTLTQNIITKNVDCVSLEADLVSCDTLTIKGVEYPQSIDSVISATQHQSAVTNPYALTTFASSLSASEVTTPGQITTNTINPYGSTPTITLGSTKPGLVVNNTTGYVGIGTSSPTTFLDITGTSTSPGVTLRSIFPLSSGSSNRILLGASSTISKDAGFVDFVYTSSGSTSNQIRMGLLNQSSPMIIVSGTATTITGDVNIDSNTFKLDSVNNRVGINNSAPTQALDVVGSIVATGSITGNTIAGTISTAVQPNITQVGSLSTLVVVGETNIDSNTLRVSSALNRVGIVNPTPTEALDVNGNILASGSITGATIAGTISTASQPNITSTGTLTSLTVTGNTNIDSNTLKVDSTTNRVGVVNSTPTEALDVTGNIKASGSITGATLAGTISTAAQPNITSTGTLTSLTVSGNTTLTGDLSVDTTTIKVDSSNNMVGINTATPASELDVTGNIKISGKIIGPTVSPTLTMNDIGYTYRYDVAAPVGFGNKNTVTLCTAQTHAGASNLLQVGTYLINGYATSEHTSGTSTITAVQLQIGPVNTWGNSTSNEFVTRPGASITTTDGYTNYTYTISMIYRCTANNQNIYFLARAAGTAGTGLQWSSNTHFTIARIA